MSAQHRKFGYLGTSEQQIIPVPHDITEGGYREILRVWRKPGGNKDKGDRIQALARGTFENPAAWTGSLTVITRTLAALYYPEGEPIDHDRMAAAMLGGAISLIAAEQPLLNADLIEADIGDFMGADAAPVEILPPEPVAEALPEPTAGPEGVSEAQPASADPLAGQPAYGLPVLELDQRSLPVPQEVVADPNAQHLLTIWVQPDVPGCAECPDCGIDHMGRTYIGINTEHLTDKVMGRTLGTVAKLHIQFRTNDATQRQITDGNIQQHFHEFMVEGLPRA